MAVWRRLGREALRVDNELLFDPNNLRHTPIQSLKPDA
jgi:hypothetical protein